MSRARLLLVTLGAALLLLGGCTSVEGAGSKGYVSGDGSVIRMDPADRGKPIDVVGKDLEGEPLDLAALRGQPVVVNVWWSGCPECRVESPRLVSAAQQLEGKATFVGLNIRDSSVDQAKSFERNHKITWRSFFSPDGKALLPFAKAGLLNPSTVPATVVLDAEGRVSAAILGEVTSSRTLVDLVSDVAAGL